MLLIAMDALYSFEIAIILFIQNQAPGLARFFRLVSMLGYEEFYMLAMPLLYWSLDSVLGLRMAILLLLSNGLNMALKIVFHAPRPYWLDARVKGYFAEDTYGIPSGHAQNAAVLWGLLATTRSKTWEKWMLVGLIFLIGFSRLYLGMHFLTDILAGWLIGWLLLFVFLKLENPLAAWLKQRSLGQQIGLAAATSLLLLLAIILPIIAMGAWQLPSDWLRNALVSQPGETIEPLKLDGAFTISGTWLGMMAGVAWMYHYRGGFNVAGTPGKRLLRYPVGVAGIFLLWFGLGMVLPENADAMSYGLRYFRYTLVGLWISAVAPLLFERIGLATAPEKKITSFSSTENPL
jgi:membrane-associated phospholipid phosphatase